MNSIEPLPFTFTSAVHWMGPDGKLFSREFSHENYMEALGVLFGFITEAMEYEGFRILPPPLHLSLSIHRDTVSADSQNS